MDSRSSVGSHLGHFHLEDNNGAMSTFTSSPTLAASLSPLSQCPPTGFEKLFVVVVWFLLAFPRAGHLMYVLLSRALKPFRH